VSLRPDGSYPIGHVCPDRTALPMGTHHVDLLSGYHRDVELPSLGQWIRYGYIPNPLMDIAVKREWPDFKPEALEDEERARFDDLIDFVVADMTRPKMPIEFVRGFEDGKSVSPCLPREDRDSIWGVAIRQVPVGEAAEIIKEVKEAMSKFRGFPERPPVAGNGASKGRGSRQRAPRR
jgi:hypothetical protein